jgi:hypothetical protein
MSFSLDINKFVKKVAGPGGKADQVVRKVVLDVGRSVVLKTPVGDPDYWQSPPPKGYVGGHARGNWSHTAGRFISPDDLPKELEEIDASGAKSINRISRSCKLKGAAGLIHFISNSVPYINRLEDGYSRQAPNGMVGLTIREFDKFVREATEGAK